MMEVIKPLDHIGNATFPMVYLPGAVSDGGQWRRDAIEALQGDPTLKGAILDPYVADYPSDDYGRKCQVKWEQMALHRAHVVAFWMIPPTDNPISLFELGRVLDTHAQKLVIGCHPEYSKADDIQAHIHLLKPHFRIRREWGAWLDEVKEHLRILGQRYA